MDDISTKCLELNTLLRESTEYKTYIAARNAIRSNEALFNSMMEFKQRYTDVMMYTEGNPYDEILRMYSENDELIHNSTVNEYLRAESSFSRLIRKVISDVSQNLKIEI